MEPDAIELGGAVTLKLTLELAEGEPAPVLVDFAVHHVRKNGKTSPKVFKWTRRTLKPGKALSLSKVHKVKPVTTRRYYPGEHPVEVLVNGVVLARSGFSLSVPTE